MATRAMLDDSGCLYWLASKSLIFSEVEEGRMKGKGSSCISTLVNSTSEGSFKKAKLTA
jgi:hypothetical protein